jgi:FkbM family methyltransferase
MSRRFLSFLASRLPSRWIRWGGRIRERFPILTPVVSWLARDVLAAQGVIRHGIGAGLRFDARRGSAGYLFGTAEPEEQAALARYLKAGDVFYDLGANIGFFAVLAARLVGNSGRVYAFEPNPECSTEVRRNADLNGFSHVEVVEAAVSSKSGRARLRLGDTNLSSAIAGSSDAGIDVALTTVDDFMRDRSPRPPTLVMIDVEGAEIDVLRGMRETITRHCPVIMCEVHWIGAEFLRYCAQHLAPAGYVVEPLEGREFPSEPSRFHALLLPGRAPAADGSGPTDRGQ